MGTLISRLVWLGLIRDGQNRSQIAFQSGMQADFSLDIGEATDQG